MALRKQADQPTAKSCSGLVPVPGVPGEERRTSRRPSSVREAPLSRPPSGVGLGGVQDFLETGGICCGLRLNHDGSFLKAFLAWGMPRHGRCKFGHHTSRSDHSERDMRFLGFGEGWRFA